jgi:phosphatidylglycerophosphate synthase
MTLAGRPSAAHTFALPNLLTFGRIAAIPAVVACLFWSQIFQGGLWLRWVALFIFITAALIILLREIAVSGLREFLAGLRVSVPVSQLAKWKTTFQLISLGALILGGALPSQSWIALVGLFCLWSAAGLTVVTGWDYLRVGLKHMD